MIEMNHPIHGTKHAYLEAEAVQDEKNGWKRVNPSVTTVAITTDAQTFTADRDPIYVPLASRDELAAEYEAKFGKKPHHKMKAETIAEKLK